MAQKGQQQNRSAARETATSANAGGSTGRTMPKPVEETGNAGTDAAEAPKEPTALVLIVDNPKRKGSQAYDFFAKYPKRHTLSHVDAAKEAGVRGKDLTWDAASNRRHILIGDEAKNFPIDGSSEEQAEYLRKLDPQFFTDAVLIKRGYLPEPVAEEKKEEATQNA